MAPHTTAQRSAISEFVNFTRVDKTTASKILKSHNWNTQTAIAAYFNNSGASPAASELSRVFDKYRDDATNSPDTIGMDGTQKYCEDIGVSVEDVSFLVLSDIVQSSTMGEINREGFVNGWIQAGVTSISSQSAFVKRRTAELSQATSRDTFKRVYRHTFKLFLQPPARSLDLETAILLWTILFSPQGLAWTTSSADWFELWKDFLQNKSKRPINKDVWDQTLVFAEHTVEDGSIAFWSEDGAWPGVIDEFVEWIKSTRPELDPEKGTDGMEVE